MYIYYGWVGGDLLFGSELKALRRHPRFDNPIEPEALQLFLRRGYVPAPLSIHRHIFKLEPGCILTLTAEAAGTPLEEAPDEGQAGPVSLTRYWAYRDVVREGLERPIADEAEALEELEQALATAIAGQSMADVPVGAFLSGGIDSSTVVALYQKHSPMPARTFSIGFEEAAFNEAGHARQVAAHLGTVHNEHVVTAGEAREVIPLLPAMYDEPFADASQIPTFLVSRFARAQVTVALTGDGGDELFGGYNRHVGLPHLWQRAAKLPRGVRAVAASALGLVPAALWNAAASLAPGERQPDFGTKMHKALRVAATARNFDEACAQFLDDWAFEAPPMACAGAGDAFAAGLPTGTPEAVRLMVRDAVTYLPDDVLAKVDRASMAVSLETRVPFLDHRVAAVAARIPLAMKIHGGAGKQILRKLLWREVPRDLVERPKAGFGVPVGDWIKGPLRPWAEELLSPAALADGWLDAAVIQRRWQDHFSGRRDSSAALWSVLMFQAWRREQGQSAALAA